LYRTTIFCTDPGVQVTISRPPADYSMGKKQANKIIGKLALKNSNDMDVVIL